MSAALAAVLLLITGVVCALSDVRDAERRGVVGRDGNCDTEAFLAWL